MYTVIGFPKTRTMRVMWMLEELGEAYDLVPAMPRSEEIRAHNLMGKVPALVDDGRTVIDSVAICQYLADKHDNLTFPAGTMERATQDSFTQFAIEQFESPLWTAAKNTFVLPEDVRMPEIKSVCRAEFDIALNFLAKRLGGNQFVMGDTFTVPDIILGHCGNWAKAAKFSIPDGPLTGYFDRVLSRPAYQRAQERGEEAAATG